MPETAMDHISSGLYRTYCLVQKPIWVESTSFRQQLVEVIATPSANTPRADADGPAPDTRRL